MKPVIRKVLLTGVAGLAAIALSGCVYYPRSYGYGYGGGYGDGYYAAPAYVAPPVVSGSVTLGGWWWGGGDHDRGGWQRHGWGWGDHDGWRH